jgi:hypothetical protein
MFGTQSPFGVPDLPNAYDLLSRLGSKEVVVVGARSLDRSAFGRWHRLQGTSADYTVTLPPAQGNEDRLIGFRVPASATASRLYTLDGYGSETIDGATTRVLWAEESAVLRCDGSNWFKVAGKSRPMFCQMYLSSDVGPLAQASVTKVDVDAVGGDNTGLMADTTNKRINIKRTSSYLVKGGLTASDSAGSGIDVAIPRFIVIVQKNAATTVAQGEGNAPIGSYAIAHVIAPADLVAGDHLQLYYYQDGGNTLHHLLGDPGYVDIDTMNCVELPSW